MALVDEQLTTEEDEKKAARELRQRAVAPTAEETGTIGDQISAGDPKRILNEERNRARQASAAEPVAADQSRARSFGGRMRELRQAVRATQNPPQTLLETGEALAEAAARQIQKSAWNVAHEIAEDITLGVWPLAFLVGFIPVALILWRVVFGNILGNFFTIGYRGFQLPIAPPFSFFDAPLRVKGILAYLVWGLEWAILVILYYVLIYCSDNKAACLTG